MYAACMSVQEHGEVILAVEGGDGCVVQVENAPFLGGFIMEQDEMIQFIDLGRLRDRVRLLPVPQERE